MARHAGSRSQALFSLQQRLSAHALQSRPASASAGHCSAPAPPSTGSVLIPYPSTPSTLRHPATAKSPPESVARTDQRIIVPSITIRNPARSPRLGTAVSRPREASVRPILYVGNQNYSSWSLRPWLVLTWGGI